MSPDIGVEPDAEEIDAFLREQGLGVLGIAKGGQAYTIPIAFAYDSGSNRCFFRFIMDDDSIETIVRHGDERREPSRSTSGPPKINGRASFSGDGSDRSITPI